MSARRRARLVDAGRAWVRRHSWVAAAALVVAVAVAMVAVFGGLRASGTAEVAEVAVGEVVDSGPWDVQVERVRAIDEFPTLSHADAGHRWIAVVVTMTNRTSHTAPAGATIGDVVDVGAFPGQRVAEPQVVLVSDGSSPVQLVPGVPDEVALFWEQDAGEPPPASLDVVISGYRLRRDTFTDALEWKDPAPVARLRAPVARGQG